MNETGKEEIEARRESSRMCEQKNEIASEGDNNGEKNSDNNSSETDCGELRNTNERLKRVCESDREEEI